ncbi:MAG: 50S ribosomal protein L33 [Candidatus Hodgkinia cicadicola]
MSTQNTGTFYVTRKSIRAVKRLAFRKYDSVLRGHREFRKS